MKLAGTRLKHHPSRAGLTVDTKNGPVWTGEVRLNEQWLDHPLRWRDPRMIFVCAHGDLFYERVPLPWQDKVVGTMGSAPRHIYQVLTKRPDLMRSYFEDLPGRIHDLACNSLLDWIDLPMPSVWLGCSIEDQRHADERREPMRLLAEMGWLTWVSYEPALGPIDWTGWEFLRWIVSGGESGEGARPSHPDWHRATRDFCASHGIAYLFKQWGAWGPARPVPSGTPGRYAIANAGPHSSFLPAMVTEVDTYPRQFSLFGGATVRELVGKKRAGRLLDGREHNEFPKVAA
ncbi:hypothetical protein MesoLjLc_51920 [Mesorhizobium sp. L-8-10]|nr:hypothetical protein MesoLjLc_51920 [Mesorhizobium sp. L-8-10]